jgi:hypothetical protein
VIPNSGIVIAVLLTGAVAFIDGVLLARVYPGGDAKPLYDLLIAAIGAFAGTAAGVWIGLSVDKKRRDQETEDRRVEAANVAIYNLSQIYSFSWDYHRQIIAPSASHPNRWFRISRSDLPAPALRPFEADRLAFLFEGPYMSLPSRVSIEFVRFDGFLHTMRRALNVNDEVQTLARAKPAGDPLPQSPIDLFNHATKMTLSHWVDTLIEHNTSMRASVMETALELRNALLAMYPHRTIIRFQPMESLVKAATPES